MKKLLQLALGIIAAVGGFVDIGDLVFNAAAGAKFGYNLLWALLVGTIGIVVFAEMSGRVVSVVGKTSFDLIRDMYPPRLGFATLLISTISNVLTCAAEIGGVALVLNLLTNYPYKLLVVLALLALIISIWYLRLNHIERIFGYVGVALVLFVITAIKSFHGWAPLHYGVRPHGTEPANILTYLYFAVGIIGSTLMPYEVYFYSSGGKEDGWQPKDAKTQNRMNAVLGFGVGAIVAAGILVTAANVFGGKGLDPELIGTTALSVVPTLGTAGLLLTLLGMLFAVGGATVETCFAGVYDLCQYAGWAWGKNKPPLQVPAFTWSWIVILVVAAAIVFFGVNPVTLTEYAVIFSLVVMPLTYWPILKAARNRRLLGDFANGRVANVLGWVYMVIIAIVAVVAVPLMFITNRGQ